MRARTLLIDRASITRVLTAAETLALNTSAIQLLGAPGAGRCYAPEYMVVSKPAGVAGAGGGNLFLRLGTTGVLDDTRARLFPAGASTRRVAPDHENVTLTPNAAMDLHMATGNMTGQDQDVTITVVYSVFATS